MHHNSIININRYILRSAMDRQLSPEELQRVSRGIAVTEAEKLEKLVKNHALDEWEALLAVKMEPHLTEHLTFERVLSKFRSKYQHTHNLLPQSNDSRTTADFYADLKDMG